MRSVLKDILTAMIEMRGHALIKPDFYWGVSVLADIRPVAGVASAASR
jgi:hypothetical protein